MADHPVLPFDLLHKAKFDSGLAANLPPVPEGFGDAYWASNTQQLYIANAAADGWIVASGATNLSQLSDVDPTLAPTDGNSLYYNGTDSEWKVAAGNLNLLSSLTMSGTTNPTISGINALGDYRYFILEYGLRKSSGTGVTRADRVIPISVNSGISLDLGLYQEWSDLGNNAGTTTLSDALLATNDNAGYSSNNKAVGRMYIPRNLAGSTFLICESLLFSVSGGAYHKLNTQFFFYNVAIDSIQITGTFDTSSYMRLYGHRY